MFIWFILKYNNLSKLYIGQICALNKVFTFHNIFSNENLNKKADLALSKRFL